MSTEGLIAHFRMIRFAQSQYTSLIAMVPVYDYKGIKHIHKVIAKEGVTKNIRDPMTQLRYSHNSSCLGVSVFGAGSSADGSMMSSSGSLPFSPSPNLTLSTQSSNDFGSYFSP